MTSASERTDDDVIIVTEDDDLADEPRGAHAAPDPADRELPGDRDGDEPAGDDLADDDLADDELADVPAASERDVAYAGPGDEAIDESDPDTGPDGDAVADHDSFASHGAANGAEYPVSGDPADTGAAATAQSSAGPFAMPGASPVNQPDDRSTVAGAAQPGYGPTVAGAAQPGSGPVTLPDVSPVDQSADDPVAPLTADDPVQPAASSPAAVPQAVQPDENWPEIQSMFVDDPRSAVERAAEVASAALNALMVAARQREQLLRQDWEADGTGTEELRTSLQHYRELANRLARLSGEL